MEWARILAYISGTVDQELLLRNEYLAAENHPGKAPCERRFPFFEAGLGPPAKLMTSAQKETTQESREVSGLQRGTPVWLPLAR
jgi:hypothetical protein